MRDEGKASVLGVQIDRVDYDGAVERVIAAAKAGRPCAVSALAVHGVMSGVGHRNAEYRWRVNHMDLVTPDGQPVRWALNLLYRARLSDRVYGPTLTSRILARCAADGLPVYFCGSTADVVAQLATSVRTRWPALQVAGAEPSRFRPGGPAERDELAARIRASGARVAFIGLGCPRQEVLVSDLRDRVALPLLAVGAAFDYHAGVRREPPPWVQRGGLQWLYRLAQEPTRLWRRYLILNPEFVVLLILQRLGWWRPDCRGRRPDVDAEVDL